VISSLDGFQSSIDLGSADRTVLSITILDTEANAEATFGKQLPQMLGDRFKDWAGHRASVDHSEVSLV